MRGRDWLRGDPLGWREVEAGRPGLRGAAGLETWARTGPGPRLPECLGRRSAAVADPEGFCSWSLLRIRGQEKTTGVRDKERHFQNAFEHRVLHRQSWEGWKRPGTDE